MEEEYVDKICEALLRNRIYYFFSAVYLKQVSRNFLRDIKREDILKRLKDLGIKLGKDFYNTDEEKLLDRLAAEYSSLFNKQGGLIPEESANIAHCGKQKPSVKEIYTKAGFDIPENLKVSPDHLSVELEFMGGLVKKEAKAWQKADAVEAEKWRNLQIEFLLKHLGLWVMEFAKKVEETSSHSFYKGIARLTREFMDSELDELLGDTQKQR